MLYVVRHGHTDWNSQKITMGRKDIKLNELGIKEAYSTSELLRGYNFDFIICSPLVRAKQTADIINKNRNNQIIYDERIIERSLGNLEGKPYTSNNNQIWDVNVNTDSDGIETMSDFRDRVYGFLDEIIKNHSDKNVLLVTHGGVSALINCYFNGTLYDGSISDKFLKNCGCACYDTKAKKKLILYGGKNENNKNSYIPSIRILRCK